MDVPVTVVTVEREAVSKRHSPNGLSVTFHLTPSKKRFVCFSMSLSRVNLPDFFFLNTFDQCIVFLNH